MSARVTLALVACLTALGCSSGDPDAVRAAQTEEQTLAKAGASSNATPAATTTPESCLAESGIWTARLSPASAATAVLCTGPSVTSSFYGSPDGGKWNFLMTDNSGCTGGTTTDPEGCAEICTTLGSNGTAETTLTIENATTMTGSAVVTLKDGTRCEYDVTVTKG